MTTIFPMFLLASMCRWASAMSSRLNTESITGIKEPIWLENCGSTRCVKAFTRSALYWEKRREVKMGIEKTHRHTVLSGSFLLPGGCESGGGWRVSGLAWTAVCPEDRPLLSFLPWCRRAPICHPLPNSWHFAPSSGRRCSRGWRLPPCLRNQSHFFLLGFNNSNLA